MKKYFLTGLSILMPFVLTLYLTLLLIYMFTAPFRGWIKDFFSYTGWIPSETAVSILSTLFSLFAVFLLICACGALSRFIAVRRLFRLFTNELRKLPMVNGLYSAFHKLTKVLFDKKNPAFSQVVLLPYPSEHSYCIGIITEKRPDGTFLVVVPEALNPTISILQLCKGKDLIYIDMTIEEALKFIHSCGMLFEKWKGVK